MPIFRRMISWLRTRRPGVDAVLNALADPVFVLDRHGRYLDVLGGNERSLYDDSTHLIGKTLHAVLPADTADHYLEMIHQTLETGTIRVVEYALSAEDVAMNPKDGPSGVQWFQGRISPLHVPGKAPESVLWAVINISDKKHAELERDRAMERLEIALSEIRTLRGILPICCACKKIRDEGGGWHELESYISAHSDADFSHGICPECMRSLYPECVQSRHDKG